MRNIARKIEQALSALPGTLDVRDDWRTRLLRYDVVVDQYKALHAGVSTHY
ncbi:rnd superfamily protein, partial [Pseudomonas savastanoi pv. glycinea str. race 4]